MVQPHPANVEIDGAKVREMRKLHGLTLKKMALKCDISFQYLSDIERGRRPFVSPPFYARICDVLGVRDRRKLLKVAA